MAISINCALEINLKYTYTKNNLLFDQISLRRVLTNYSKSYDQNFVRYYYKNKCSTNIVM